MENVTIVSHLTPLEWKRSWHDKVIEDTEQNKKEYQMSSCYWGHFTAEREFILCYHREGEIKGMSLALYFWGQIENDEQGCRIVGKFGKKKTANIFLIIGILLCLAALLGSILQADRETMITVSVLLVILLLVYMMKPAKGQEKILKQLEKISFDDKFRKKGIPKKGK